MAKELSPYDKKRLESWAETREEGRWKYALNNGVVVGVFVALTIRVFALSSTSFLDAYLSLEFLLWLAISIAVHILGYYTTLWPINERYFQKHKDELDL